MREMSEGHDEMETNFARADRSNDADEITGMRIEHNVFQDRDVHLEKSDDNL